MSNIWSILGDIEGFVSEIIGSLERDEIDVSDLELDHLCYRVETEEEYINCQKELSKLGELLVEIEINGRLISTYRLNDPMRVNDREIFVVELPSPKEGSPYPNGLEHAEFVIKDSFEEFMSKHPNAKFDTKDISKSINPDIRVKYGEFSIKFHHKPLEYVIKYEQ